MTSTVYFGSPRQARLEAKETLPAKFDLILEKMNLRDRVKGEVVSSKCTWATTSAIPRCILCSCAN